MNNKGDHVLADIYTARDYSGKELVGYCRQCIASSGMSIEREVIVKFEPVGLTAVWVLSESHFTLHTYPEHKYISVDCYTCGDEGKPADAINYLLQALELSEYSFKQIDRG